MLLDFARLFKKSKVIIVFICFIAVVLAGNNKQKNLSYFGPYCDETKHGQWFDDTEKIFDWKESWVKSIGKSPATYIWKKPHSLKSYYGEYIILVGEWKNNNAIGAFLIYTRNNEADVTPSLIYNNQEYYRHEHILKIGTMPPWNPKHVKPSKDFFGK
ncbi:hypothetical protein [Candidatus Uabimicrobium sp. HlEnr_7]|uniref:hypothetical protein n=1 Tax=Candidatus Uabimicrobium helgolandensis TaxID=3095367 RepID=UPI0035584C85